MLRGTIVSVVNLRVFLGLPRLDNYNSPKLAHTDFFYLGIGGSVPRLLVLRNEELFIGMVVDDIRGTLFVNPAEIRPTNFPQAYLEGAYTDPNTNKLIWLFDTGKLLTSPEILVFEPAI